MIQTSRKPSWVPSVLRNRSAESDGGGGGGGDSDQGGDVEMRKPAGTESNGRERPPAGDAAEVQFSRPLGASATAARSPASQAFPPVMAPAYSTSAAPSGSVAALPSGDESMSNTGAFRRGSSITEARAAETQASLEAMHDLSSDISAVESRILGVERELEDAQEAVSNGGSYRGKSGGQLAAEEKRLGRKEQLLREEKAQLREEKLALLRLQGSRHDEKKARKGRVSFIMTQSHVDDPSEELAEQRRMSQVQDLIKERRMSTFGGDFGDEAGDDTIVQIHRIEEDSRLLVRLNAFGLPILVSTLVSGFTLVLFDVAKTELARRLAVLSFAVEMSSSIVLCLIAFRGQQLYSHATDIKPLTRKFLQRMCNVTLLSLVLFSAGVIVFVVAFVIEASEEMGAPWLGVLALTLCPTILAGLMFAASTAQVRRHSFPSGVPTPGTQ
ncbi:unnamed protein product [Scytosiphon promiscuus]